jgi:probable HAF family extracellular repeat protein
LGGPSSVSYPIGKDGSVIGTSCLDAACAIIHAFRWDKGVLTDLGALPGENSSIPTWINDHGRIVGFSTNGVDDPFIGGPEIRGVRFRRDGSVTELGILEGGTQTFTLQNNNRGDAVGFGNNSISDPFSMGGLGTQTRAISWRHGVPHDLGTLGGDDATAAFINDRRQIAGQSYTNSEPNPTTGIPTQDPFLWEKGRMFDLGSLGGTSGFPEAFNNRGQVVGQSNLEGDRAFHPFLWERGKLKDLGTFGGEDGQAIWINDRGEVIGEADYPIACGSTCGHPQVYRPFLWRRGKMIDLGAVPGEICGFAYGINNKTQVVGSNGQCHGGIDAFLWERGVIHNLNDLIPTDSPLHLVFANFINDRGEIIGTGVPPGVSVYDVGPLGHAYLLIPLDKDNDHEQNVVPDAATATISTTTSPRSAVGPKPALRTHVPDRYRMY